MPRSLTVPRLAANQKPGGNSTGRSLGRVSFGILSTKWAARNRASVDQVDQHHMRCRSGSSIRAGDLVSLLGGVIDQFLQRIRRKCPPGHDGHGTSATSPMYSNDVRGHAVLPWSAKCPKSTFGAQSKPEFEDPTTMIPWPASGRGHRSSQSWKMYPRRRMEK